MQHTCLIKFSPIIFHQPGQIVFFFSWPSKDPYIRQDLTQDLIHENVKLKQHLFTYIQILNLHFLMT